MNGHTNHHDHHDDHHQGVIVVGYQFSGAEMVHHSVNQILRSRHEYSPPSVRNGFSHLTAKCCINQLPSEHVWEHISRPSAKVVYVLRNPKDIAVVTHKNSGFETTRPFSDFLEHFMTEDTEGGRWFQHTSQWMKALSTVHPSQIHLVYFSSLILSLEEEIVRLSKFLDISLSAETLGQVCSLTVRESDQPQRKRQRTSHIIDDHKDMFYQSGLWKTYFSVSLNVQFDATYVHLLNTIPQLDTELLLS